ncbi:MAG: vitamin K epoxide reductase family protein [Candidatus Poseidoniaceae archaeon]|nr:vitamin K epoxide reductase family protein [Candidatus Poseidoniaceae archaeon]
MELDANQQLMFHWIPIVLGVLLMSPMGKSFSQTLSSMFPGMEHQRGRTIGGMILVFLGGFTVSVHTLWIHNKSKELGAGNFCSGDGIWDCSSVIGNDAWNTMPVTNLPWGLVGMMAFCILAWLVISIGKDSTATWVNDHIKYGLILGYGGLVIIAYLAYGEYQIGKLCQYCTTAHVAHVAGLLGFIHLNSMVDTAEWGSDDSIGEDDAGPRVRRKRGYVAPTTTKDDSEE